MFGWTSLAIFTAGALFSELALYALACTAAALPFARSLELPALLALPAVIAVHHVAYGLGFLIGVTTPPGSGTGPRSNKLFTALTR
jgi:hypothetical protein